MPARSSTDTNDSPPSQRCECSSGFWQGPDPAGGGGESDAGVENPPRGLSPDPDKLKGGCSVGGSKDASLPVLLLLLLGLFTRRH